jgi:hypothetical protein
VNQKVKAIFKLHGNRDREDLAHCALLTVPVEEFSCSPSLEVKAAPRQKAIHYLHMGQQPSKQKEL